jgi:hypothetical protein
MTDPHSALVTGISMKVVKTCCYLWQFLSALEALLMCDAFWDVESGPRTGSPWRHRAGQEGSVPARIPAHFPERDQEREGDQAALTRMTARGRQELGGQLSLGLLLPWAWPGWAVGVHCSPTV